MDTKRTKRSKKEKSSNGSCNDKIRVSSGSVEIKDLLGFDSWEIKNPPKATDTKSLFSLLRSRKS